MSRLGRLRYRGPLKPKDPEITNFKLTHFKRSVLDTITSQGILSKTDALSLIVEGRVRINNTIYYEPHHGVHLRPGTDISIDTKTKFKYYPYLYLIYNKPLDIQSSIDSKDSPKNKNVFPSYWFNRKTSKYFQPLYHLSDNMSGLVVYTDDRKLRN